MPHCGRWWHVWVDGLRCWSVVGPPAMRHRRWGGQPRRKNCGCACRSVGQCSGVVTEFDGASTLRARQLLCPSAWTPERCAPWQCGATERRGGSWAGTGWARWKGQAGGMIGQSLSLMRCLWPVPMLLDGRCRRGDQIEIRVVVQIVINDVWIFVTASLLVHHPLAEDQCHQK